MRLDFNAGGWAGPVINDGLIDVSSTGYGFGVDDGSPGGIAKNSGTRTINVVAVEAIGVNLRYGHEFDNSGRITVSSTSNFAIGASITSFGSDDSYYNSGNISSTDVSQDLSSIAIKIANSSMPITLHNSGTLAGDFALVSYDYVSTIFDNSGKTYGEVLFVYGTDDQIKNTGSMSGDIYLGYGADVYDGAQGAVTGTIYGGYGDDTITAGASNDVIYGDEAQDSDQDGNDALNGGGGTDTLQGGRGDDALNGGGGDGRGLLCRRRLGGDGEPHDPRRPEHGWRRERHAHRHREHRRFRLQRHPDRRRGEQHPERRPGR